MPITLLYSDCKSGDYTIAAQAGLLLFIYFQQTGINSDLVFASSKTGVESFRKLFLDPAQDKIKINGCQFDLSESSSNNNSYTC